MLDEELGDVAVLLAAGLVRLTVGAGAATGCQTLTRIKRLMYSLPGGLTVKLGLEAKTWVMFVVLTNWTW